MTVGGNSLKNGWFKHKQIFFKNRRKHRNTPLQYMLQKMNFLKFTNHLDRQTSLKILVKYFSFPKTETCMKYEQKYE